MALRRPAALSKMTPENQIRAVIKAFTLAGQVQASELAESAHEADISHWGTKIAKPRFTPEVWLELPEQSTRLRQCITVGARNAVGLGAMSVMTEEAKSGTDGKRNLSNRVDQSTKQLALLLKYPNNKFDPFPEVMFKTEWDYLGCGNGYLEVVEDNREAGAKPVGLLHARAANMRVHVTGDKYVRLYRNSGKTIWYRRFGDDNPDHKYIDKYNGTFYAEWPGGPDYPEERKGSAIIHARNYSPLDEFYGVPPAAPAVHAIAGNKLVAIWNNNFLRNNAHIPIAVVVEGGNLSPDSLEQIELFLSRDAKGLQNVGRLMLLQPDLDRMLGGQAAKIRLEKLDMGIDNDASFLEFRERNDHEIREAFGLTGILLGVSAAATRATAVAEKQVALEQVIEPRTSFWEFVLNSTVARAVSSGAASIRFRRTTNLDALQQASVLQKLSQALTVDDIRRHAQRLLQDLKLEPLETEVSRTPLAVLAKASFSDEKLDEVLETLDQFVAPGGVLATAA